MSFTNNAYIIVFIGLNDLILYRVRIIKDKTYPSIKKLDTSLRQSVNILIENFYSHWQHTFLSLIKLS